MACIPSRSVTSWMYSFGMSAPFLFGQPLARAERCRGHDIEIAGISRQVMRRAFDFEEDRSLNTGEGANARQDHGVLAADAVELDLLLQAIAGPVRATPPAHPPPG